MRSLYLTFVAVVILQSCGQDDSSSSDCSSGCVGHGYQIDLTSGSNELDLQNSAANQKYAVVTYALGGEDINGTSSEGIATLSLEGLPETETETDETSVIGFTQSNHLKLNFDQVDHLLRRYLNTVSRNNATQKYSSKPIEYLKSISRSIPFSQNSISDQVHLVQLEKFFSNKILKTSTSRLTTASACPESLDLEFIGVEDPVEAVDYLEKEDNAGEFCLIVLGEDPVTVSSLSEIKSSVATAYGNYKLIYETDFTEKVDGFAFKPIFVLLPFDSSEYWPLGSSTLKGVTGAYFHQLSDDNGRPILILPTDVSKVNDQLSASDARNKFHATIAHELHHAVLDFYRYWVNGKQDPAKIEIGSIDEGLAHYMEDVSGYGQDTFSSFAELFLSRFAANTSAILNNVDSPVSRGGAHSLMYYLVSQKGGVTFKDGSIDTDEAASPGITFIRDYVKGSYQGTKGLFTAFGKSKTQTIGEFVGALVVDGSAGLNPLDIFKTQDTVSDVTDTSGQNNKTFGMKFNNYGNVPDLEDRLGDYMKAESLSSSSLNYYLPLPIIYSTAKEADSVRLNLATETSNLGATIIRVQ